MPLLGGLVGRPPLEWDRDLWWSLYPVLREDAEDSSWSYNWNHVLISLLSSFRPGPPRSIVSSALRTRVVSSMDHDTGLTWAMVAILELQSSSCCEGRYLVTSSCRGTMRWSWTTVFPIRPRSVWSQSSPELYHNPWCRRFLSRSDACWSLSLSTGVRSTPVGRRGVSNAPCEGWVLRSFDPSLGIECGCLFSSFEKPLA